MKKKGFISLIVAFLPLLFIIYGIGTVLYASGGRTSGDKAVYGISSQHNTYEYRTCHGYCFIAGESQVSVPGSNSASGLFRHHFSGKRPSGGNGENSNAVIKNGRLVGRPSLESYIAAIEQFPDRFSEDRHFIFYHKLII